MNQEQEIRSEALEQAARIVTTIMREKKTIKGSALTYSDLYESAIKDTIMVAVHFDRYIRGN